MNATTAKPVKTSAGSPAGPMVRLAQLWAVFTMSLRLNARAKRVWALALVCALPALPPLIFLIVTLVFQKTVHFGQAMLVFRSIVGVAHFHLVLYVLALVCGLAVVTDEVEGKTLVHLLLRPLPRWALVVGRFLSAWLVAAVLMVGSVVVTYLLLWAAQLDSSAWAAAFRVANLKTLGYNALCLVFALAAYMALFSGIAAWLPHGERWGVVFCFGWESLITYLPARLKWFTLMYHVQTICPHEMQETALGKILSLRGDRLPQATCLIVLISVIVVGLALTVRNLRRRELR